MAITQQDLKARVQQYWEDKPCGAQVTGRLRYSREYFDEIEAYRYAAEPEIFSFAQFTRWHGRKVLEVGVGAGTDFLQWVRAGARAHGVDLTHEAVEHVRHRLEAYGLRAEEVRQADCEMLPYPAEFFDLVYSWGVIHHTADTRKALEEIVRVLGPGGTGKVMIYNRRSLCALRLWVRHALLAGRPWRSFSDVLWHHMESIGTKAFTRREARRMLAPLPVREVRIDTILTRADRCSDLGWVLRASAAFLALLLGGKRAGWFMTIEFTKSSNA